MRKRVYVAGPISKGSLEANVQQALDAGHKLLRAGFAPMVPHLTCYWAGNHTPTPFPRGVTHDEWLAVDLPWVSVADLLLRLPGESAGADREVQLARSLSIPVYWDIDTLLEVEAPSWNHHACHLR